MNDYIQPLRDDVRRLLDAGIESENDFVFVAIAGERLRRALRATETERDEISDAYDAFLASKPGRIPTHLGDDVTATLLDLREYAEQPISQREVDQGQALLNGLDELLCAVAAARRVSDGAYADIDTRVAEGVIAIAPRLGELAEFAERQQELLAPDTDQASLFQFWELIARFAPTRMAGAITVQAQRRRDQVLAAFERSLAGPLTSSFRELDEELAFATERGRVSPLLMQRIERFAVEQPGAEADVLLAGALQVRREVQTALVVSERALAAALRGDDACLVLRCMVRKAGVLDKLAKKGDAKELRVRARDWFLAPALEQAVGSDDPLMMPQLRLMGAILALGEEDGAAAGRYAQEVIDLAESAGSRRLGCTARAIRTVARLAMHEAPAVLLSEARWCITEARTLGLLETLTAAAFIEGLVLLALTRPKDAAEALELAQTTAAQVGDRHMVDSCREFGSFARGMIEERSKEKRVRDFTVSERLAVRDEDWQLALAATFQRALLLRENSAVAARLDISHASELADICGDQSSSFWTRTLLFYWLVEDGLLEEAADLCTSAVGLAATLPERERARAEHVSFLCALVAEDHEAALSSIRRAYELAGDDDTYDADLVFALAASGRPTEARQVAQREAVAPELLVDHIETLLRMERHDAALALSSDLVAIGNPGAWRDKALFVRSLALAATGDMSGAHACLTDVILTGRDAVVIESARVRQLAMRMEAGPIDPGDEAAMALLCSDNELVDPQLEVTRDLLRIMLLMVRGQHGDAIRHAAALRASDKALWPDALAVLTWNDVAARFELHHRRPPADVVGQLERIEHQAALEVDAEGLSPDGQALRAYTKALVLHCQGNWPAADAVLHELLGELSPGPLASAVVQFRDVLRLVRLEVLASFVFVLQAALHQQQRGAGIPRSSRPSESALRPLVPSPRGPSLPTPLVA